MGFYSLQKMIIFGIFYHFEKMLEFETKPLGLIGYQ